MLQVHTLPDVLQAGLRAVFCGTAAGNRSAEVGAYYAGRGNQFWPTLHAVGLTPRQLLPTQFRKLPTYGIGLTDIAKYRAGADATLSEADFDIPSFRAKLATFVPTVAAFNGKKAAAVFYGCGTRDIACGPQPTRIGETTIWVLPSTSGGARGFWDLKQWEDLAALVR